MLQRKILVVEDNMINREMLCDMLSSAYEVLDAENGQEALDVLKKYGEEISLILLDIVMPVMDGYHAAQAIRSLKNPSLARIPIIAVSANAFEEDRRKALECGMNAHVAKPVDITQLLSAISSTLYSAGN